jgi:hypothetical protein
MMSTRSAPFAAAAMSAVRPYCDKIGHEWSLRAFRQDCTTLLPLPLLTSSPAFGSTPPASIRNVASASPSSAARMMTAAMERRQSRPITFVVRAGASCMDASKRAAPIAEAMSASLTRSSGRGVGRGESSCSGADKRCCLRKGAPDATVTMPASGSVRDERDGDRGVQSLREFARVRDVVEERSVVEPSSKLCRDPQAQIRPDDFRDVSSDAPAESDTMPDLLYVSGASSVSGAGEGALRRLSILTATMRGKMREEEKASIVRRRAACRPVTSGGCTESSRSK